MQIKERDFIGSLAKGLNVLESFSQEQPKMSISEVAEHTNLDRATARRCLLTLAKLGYLSYDGKFFTVTPRILRLGTACLAALPLPRIVQPALDRLSEKIQQSISVSILDADEIVYIARAAQHKIMSITLMPGSRLPAYCSSMGRVLLASLDDEAAKAILQNSKIVKNTVYTKTDHAEILAEIQKIRQIGYCFLNQEIELGLASIAIPLKNNKGQIIAAVNIGLPAHMENLQSHITQYLPELFGLQKELSYLL